MKTIVATAYAINPYKGSEDGMGWNFVLQIARFNKVIAITRENNRPHIEKYQSEFPDERYKNMQFLYFDLPYWMRFWKKGGRGAMLYYQMWQRGVVAFIKKQKLSYTIAHNLNFHNDWTPTFLWKLNKPLVWGPIGHHPKIPKMYFAYFPKSEYYKDLFTWLIKKAFWKFSIALTNSVKKANYILCMNSGVAKHLNIKGKTFSVNPSVATQDFGWQEHINSESFTLISAGRLVPLKGFDLTILSFARFVSQLDDDAKALCSLKIVGSGPYEQMLKKLAADSGVASQVEFISWIERNELMKLMKTSSAFLFPSHEGAGMVVAEALSFGLPVICLENEGPGEFITTKCGIAVQMNSYDQTVNDLSKAITLLYSNKSLHTQMRHEARLRFESYFDWDIRGNQLKKIYDEVGV
jgi:glycosyltransferase involved in cell wall biosynthesis